MPSHRGRRPHLSGGIAGIALLATLCSGSAAAQVQAEPAAGQEQVAAAQLSRPHADVAPHTDVRPQAGDRPDHSALQQVMRRYLGKHDRDPAGLRRDLGNAGARDVQITDVSRHGSARSLTAEGDNGKCPAPTKNYRFECELLFFHEVSPGHTYQADVAVLTWDFIPVGANKPKGSPLDDIAAIDFGNYDEKCYEPAHTSWAAWTAPPGSELNDKPAQNVSDLVRAESSDPGTNATVFRIVDEPGEADLPKPLTGYVEVDLQHRYYGPDCTEPHEIRAEGHYLHNEDGEGDWDGVTVGAGYGPLSVSYTPDSDPGIVRQSSTGILALHAPELPGTTRLNYTGPTQVRYHVPFTASARLVRAGGTQALARSDFGTGPRGAHGEVPVQGAHIRFTLGIGGALQSCTGTTDAAGVARCVLTPNQRAGQTTMTIRYLGGNGTAASSSFVAFTVQPQVTEVAYTGPRRIANGTPAHLSGVLRERGGGPIADRRVQLAIGNGRDRQACTGTTDGSGTARCTIATVDQPLNDAATVPVSVHFAGDDFYLASSASATVLLEYYTGRAYGLAGHIELPLVSLLRIPAMPDTGAVRTAHASATTTPCTAGADLGLVTAGALCPHVTTTLAPGTSTSVTAVGRVTIGVPGLPVIELRGVRAESRSTCGSGGSATGSTEVGGVYVGGQRISVSTGPNSVVDVAGVARLVINEQHPVAGAEHGLAVDGVHLTALGKSVDVVVAAASSDVHNCAS